MKRILKTYLKLFVFLFGISLLLVNCEKDIIEETEIENIHKLTVTIVGFSDVESNRKAFSKIERVINSKNESSKNSKDTISNNEYGFSIDTDYVKYIENGNYNSYNFEIIRDLPEDDKLENLFLTLNEDGEYDAFIIKYDFTVEELNNLTQEELGNRTTQYTAIDFDSSFLNNKSASKTELSCESQYEYVCVESPILGIYGFEVCSWTSEIVCTGGGGPGPGPSSGNPTSDPISGGNQGSGSSGGSNTGTYTPSNPYSAPTTPPTMSEMLGYFIDLTPEQRLWVGRPENEDEAQLLIDYFLLCSDPNFCGENDDFGELALDSLVSGTIEEQNAVLITLSISNSDLLYGPYDSTYYNIINEYTELNLTDPTLIILWQVHFTAQCAIIKVENPDWSDARVKYEAVRELMHIGLDLAGMVPVVGIVFDVVNGVAYAIEGEGLDAALSLGAAIPVVGQWVTTAKYAKKAVVLAGTSKKVILRIYTLTNGYVKFSGRTQLRKILQITDSSIHAHHIIPYSFGVIDDAVGTAISKAQRLVQLAAKSTDAWHINDILNGIPMPNNLHLTGHSAYTTAIKNKLKDLYDNFLSSPDDYQGAFTLLSDFVSALKSKITNNPTWNSGQFVDFITNYTP